MQTYLTVFCIIFIIITGLVLLKFVHWIFTIIVVPILLAIFLYYLFASETNTQTHPSRYINSSDYYSLTLRYMWGLWDSSDIPSKYLKNQEKNQEILKGSNKITHGKKDIEDLVLKYSEEFDNEFSNIYNSIKRNVCKADLGRYLLIYYYGGVYLDNDVDIKTSFSMTDLKNHKNGVWYTENVVNVKKLDPREEKIPNRYANYIIASLYPRNQILLDIIKESSKRIKTLKDSVNWTDNDILWSTGPDVVTTILSHTKHNNYIIYNKQKSDKILIHKAEGTWRKEKDK